MAMATLIRRPLFILALLALVLGGWPLRAQLDPRLQKTPTDFLDLFQQSNTLKVKPEVATIFDFSGSMDAIMYHPAFVNSDKSDTGGQALNFALEPVSDTYTIKAYCVDSIPTTASIPVTVGGGKNSPSYGGTTTTYALSALTTAATSFVGGTAYTFTLTSKNSKPVAWSCNGGSLTWSQSGTTATAVWTAPALQTATNRAKLTLAFGSPVGTLTSNSLVKPDGSLVTEAYVRDNTTDTQGLSGASHKEADIRNWVRAASHVRFFYGGHTIDLPIPWKIMDVNSTGSPLSSKTVKDLVTSTAADGTVTSTGSNTDIEMDRSYLIVTGTGYNSATFGYPNGAAAATRIPVGTNSNLTTATYRQDYLRWAITAKYTSGPYSGTFITFDAADASLSGGQGSVDWGKGFGTFNSTDTITPVVSTTRVAASSYTMPGVTRAQAVKQAAISTWIKYQASVFWAYRFLNAANDAGGSTGTTISLNSKTTISGTDPTTTLLAGRDTGWRLLNSDSLLGMKRIASYFTGGSTPLTYAMARTFAQFSDPSSVFNAVETDTNAPVQCLKHFLILFTDGNDNNDTSGNNGLLSQVTPYLGTDNLTGNANDGNGGIIGYPSKINRYIPSSQADMNSKTWWNLYTFAGIAAHLGDRGITPRHNSALPPLVICDALPK